MNYFIQLIKRGVRIERQKRKGGIFYSSKNPSINVKTFDNNNCTQLMKKTEKKNKYIALVFEKLGKSLYEFIRENKYRGN